MWANLVLAALQQWGSKGTPRLGGTNIFNASQNFSTHTPIWHLSPVVLKAFNPGTFQNDTLSGPNRSSMDLEVMSRPEGSLGAILTWS